jgi:hypothetical protein
MPQAINFNVPIPIVAAPAQLQWVKRAVGVMEWVLSVAK